MATTLDALETTTTTTLLRLFVYDDFAFLLSLSSRAALFDVSRKGGGEGEGEGGGGVDRRHRAARWPIRFLPSRRADV